MKLDTICCIRIGHATESAFELGELLIYGLGHGCQLEGAKMVVLALVSVKIRILLSSQPPAMKISDRM